MFQLLQPFIHDVGKWSNIVLKSSGVVNVLGLCVLLRKICDFMWKIRNGFKWWSVLNMRLYDLISVFRMRFLIFFFFLSKVLIKGERKKFSKTYISIWWKITLSKNVFLNHSKAGFFKVVFCGGQFSGKMSLVIILKVTKKQGFTRTLKNLYLEKPQGVRSDWSPGLLRIKNSFFKCF